MPRWRRSSPRSRPSTRSATGSDEEGRVGQQGGGTQKLLNGRIAPFRSNGSRSAASVYNLQEPTIERKTSDTEMLGSQRLILVCQPQDFIDDGPLNVGEGLLSELHIDSKHRVCPSSGSHSHVRRVL